MKLKSMAILTIMATLLTACSVSVEDSKKAACDLWNSKLNSNTPIPTPRDSVNTSILGVFEGGGYESKGVYSPVMSCWMKVHTADGFCPVCSKTIEKVILYQTE